MYRVLYRYYTGYRHKRSYKGYMHKGIVQIICRVQAQAVLSRVQGTGYRYCTGYSVQVLYRVHAQGTVQVLMTGHKTGPPTMVCCRRH